MANHFTRRQPKRSSGLSWGRIPADDGQAVTYRLFRRDCNGRLHYEARSFSARTPRSHIAQAIHALKRQLRDRVDDIDLAAMGINQEAA